MIYLIDHNNKGPFFCFTPDPSLAALGGALKERGYDYKVFDPNPLTWSKDLFFDSIKKERPAVIGFKIACPIGFRHSIELANEIRKAHPSILIVAGGPHVTLCEEAMLRVTDAFDLLLTGEGEETIVEIAEFMEGRRRLRDIGNLICRDGGRIVRTEERVMADLDDLPLPDWGAFDLKNYFPMLYLTMQRGCPHHCTFCVSDHLWGRLRKRSLNSVLNEISVMTERYGVMDFHITDPTPDMGLVSGLCAHVREERVPLNWFAYGQVSTFLNIDPKMLAEGGCRDLLFGIESADPRILKDTGKAFSLDDVRPLFEKLKKEGIRIQASFICGFPGETKESLRRTSDFITELGCDEFSIEPFCLQPGSPMEAEPAKYSIRLDTGFREKYASYKENYWTIGAIDGDLWSAFWWKRFFKITDKRTLDRFKLTLHYTTLLAPLMGLAEDELVKAWQAVWDGPELDLSAMRDILKCCWKGAFSKKEGRYHGREAGKQGIQVV